jgi:hypothetical protein
VLLRPGARRPTQRRRWAFGVFFDEAFFSAVLVFLKLSSPSGSNLKKNVCHSRTLPYGSNVASP